jgi:voltage-gated potassium channel Kch
MIAKLLAAWTLMAVCVVVHAVGVTWAMRWVREQDAAAQRLWHWIKVFVRLAAWVVVLHLAGILGWAILYAAAGAMPDLASAVYFSAVTYTTTGYGDLVLPREWQLVGAVEALTGILMCGWSTGFFFAVVSRMFRAEALPAASRT